MNIEAVYSSYLRTGSIHKTGDEFGFSGETIRRKLMDTGKKINRSKWRSDELSRLEAAYKNPAGFNLDDLAKEFGRPKAGIACRAEESGFTTRRGRYMRTSQARANISAAKKLVAARPGHAEKMSKAISDAWKKHGHPKGFKGHKRSRANIEAMTAGIRRARANPDHYWNSKEYKQTMSNRFSKMAAARSSENCFSRTKHGKRADLGETHFRSGWEANYARYLNWLMANEKKIAKWEYEPETFWFESIRRGCRSYKPDFKVFFHSGLIEYHEVKGWMYPRAKTALKRMAKYHPSIKIQLIDSPRYKALARQLGKIIKNWE